MVKIEKGRVINVLVMILNYTLTQPKCMMLIGEDLMYITDITSEHPCSVEGTDDVINDVKFSIFPRKRGNAHYKCYFSSGVNHQA